MEAGTSVVALIKIISSILGGVKDGPANVARASRVAASLQEILEHLDRDQTRTATTPDAALHAHLKACTNDLSSFASKLAKLEALDTDSSSRKTWKRIRTIFSEKDLDMMVTSMDTHASTLSLWMVSSQRDSLRSQTEQISSISQNITSLRANNVQCDAIREEVGEVRTALSALSIQQDEQLKQIASTANTTLSRIDSQLQTIVSTLQQSGARVTEEQRTQDMLELILNAVQSLQSGTSTSEHAPNKMFDQAPEKGSAHGNLVDDSYENHTPSHSALPKRGFSGQVLGEVELIDSIDRLRKLVDRQGCTVMTETVEDVIDDLQTVLKAAQDLSRQTPSFRSLKRARGAVASAKSLSINELVRGQISGHITEQDCIWKEYNIESGTLTLSRKRRRIAHSRAEGDGQDFEQFISRLTFLPRRRTGEMFTATMGLEDRRDGTFSSIPRLIVNRIWPGDSSVLCLVRHGKLKEFQELLWDGKVSLRDHDEWGNSLLAIATNWAQPEMCKFLLSHNADVDVYCFEGGPLMDCRSSLLGAVGGKYGNEFEVDGGYPPEVFECRKLLLDAGADPTDHTDYALSGFTEACHQSTLETIRLILDRARWFEPVKQVDQFGRTPLLLSCLYRGTEPPKPIFALLLENGARLTEVDVFGHGCLCYYFDRVDRSPISENLDVIQDREGLAYLIEKGADVQATDNQGLSVSHKIYKSPLERGHLYHRVSWGSYARDLWDFALTICGYDVFAIRGKFRRVGWYTPYYTIDSFRKLWQGWEHLCPYAEDLEDDMQNGNGSTENCCSENSSRSGYQLDNDYDDHSDGHDCSLACECHDDEDDIDSDDDDEIECCRLCGWHRCCRDPICACKPDFEWPISNGGSDMESDEDEDVNLDVVSDTDSNDSQPGPDSYTEAEEEE